MKGREWQQIDKWLEDHEEWRQSQVDDWVDWAGRVARYSYRIEQN
jgi:hypothetical protein